jgi:hypothetical protein
MILFNFCMSSGCAAVHMYIRLLRAHFTCETDLNSCVARNAMTSYRTAHPVLRWLPTKLAEWIGENLQDDLGFPDKADGSGTGWTKYLLHDHVVDGALTTFGCMEWESDLFRGIMRAR